MMTMMMRSVSRLLLLMLVRMVMRSQHGLGRVLECHHACTAALLYDHVSNEQRTQRTEHNAH